MQNIDIRIKGNKKSYVGELYSFIEWTVEKKPEGNVYFQVGGLILLLLITGLLFWKKNYFGAITVLMIIFLIFISQKNKEKINCAILKKGFRIKNELFPWKNIKSFWIFENPSEIYLKTKKGIVQNIPIPIKKKDEEKIRNTLLKFIPEKEVQRSLSEIILRNIGI